MVLGQVQELPSGEITSNSFSNFKFILIMCAVSLGNSLIKYFYTTVLRVCYSVTFVSCIPC